jgi:hypothetical protein
LGSSTEEIAYEVKEANSTVTLPQVWGRKWQIVLTEYDTINRTFQVCLNLTQAPIIH